MTRGGRKALSAILGGIAVSAQAQSTAPPRSFDVASIKANRSGERIMLFKPGRGGRFTANNCSLSLLIQYAYEVLRFQISGAPDWVRSDRYDVAAKGEGDPSFDELHVMLQHLLEDRFQLKYHWETRDVAGYDLVVSKAGKLREAAPGDPPDDAPRGSLRNTPGRTKGYKLTAGDLAWSLSFFLGKSVLDKTELTGKYDIELQWTPESAQMQPSVSTEADPVESAGPTIFAALQEQLGLKLKSARAPVKMLVIDRVERPSEN